jgi:hypothetical protein
MSLSRNTRGNQACDQQIKVRRLSTSLTLGARSRLVKTRSALTDRRYCLLNSCGQLPQLFPYSSFTLQHHPSIRLPTYLIRLKPGNRHHLHSRAQLSPHSNMAAPNAVFDPAASLDTTQDFVGSDVAPSWAKESQSDIPSFVHLFEPRSETVCDFGDIILVVDDDFHPAVKIKVSSCILATARKVFKALFSNRFAEGKAVRAEHQTPCEILIKDTPNDLLLLCKLLHWQGDSRPSSHRQLRGFALTVDKYDCVEAMRHVSWSLFNPISLDDLSEHELYDLVTAAYFLDQPEAFRKLTHKIVFAYGNTLSDTYDRYTDLLPSNFTGESCRPNLLLLDHSLINKCSMPQRSAGVG